MKVVVGLGNPGKKYEKTRHNTGFRVVEALASRLELSMVGERVAFTPEEKFEAELAKLKANGTDILLIKPLTYMNLSGSAVSKILHYYKLLPKDLIVIADELDLPIGVARIRHSGGSAGHKGVQNIIECIGTDQFVRVRIGIGRKAENEVEKAVSGVEVTDFVLGEFTDREEPIIDKIVQQAVDMIIPHLDDDSGLIPAHTIEAQ